MRSLFSCVHLNEGSKISFNDLIGGDLCEINVGGNDLLAFRYHIFFKFGRDSGDIKKVEEELLWVVLRHRVIIFVAVRIGPIGFGIPIFFDRQFDPNCRIGCPSDGRTKLVAQLIIAEW